MPGNGYAYVCEFGVLEEGVPRRFEVEGVPVSLVLTERQVSAIHDVCSHSADSLSEGEVVAVTVECWLHASRSICAPADPSPRRRPAPSPCIRCGSRTETCTHK